GHSGLGGGVCCCSSNCRAASFAPLKPILLCVLSQNGLFDEAPQRHSVTVVLPGFSGGRGIGFPRWSTSTKSPVLRSTANGPFSRTLMTRGIAIGAKGVPGDRCSVLDRWKSE